MVFSIEAQMAFFVLQGDEILLVLENVSSAHLT
jgi:hypothetical protein